MKDIGTLREKGNSVETVENIQNFQNHENHEEVTWEELACVLDNLLFIVFFLLIIITSSVLFIIWGIQYES
jgi:uncharacterized membrane protein YhdT